jgi:diguanylate cyclase (GGDEF)-like protein
MQHIHRDRPSGDSLEALHGLFQRLQDRLGLNETLDAIADAVVESLGFGLAAVNLVTEGGDLECVAISGSASARQELLGKIGARAAWDDLLERAERIGELRYLDHRTAAAATTAVPSWSAPIELRAGAARSAGHRRRWYRGDDLLAPLISARIGLIGVLSVDEPAGGVLPGPRQLRLLEVFAAQARLAIENAWLVEEIRRAEAADRLALAARLEALVNAAPVGILELDLEGRLITCNPAVGELYDVTQQSFSDVLDLVRAGPCRNVQIESVDTMSSTPRVIECSSAVVLDSKGAPSGVLGILNDVTERHALSIELSRRATQQAAVADLGKAALGGGSLDELLQHAAMAVAVTLGVPIVSVHEHDVERDELFVRAGLGWPPGFVGTHRFSASEHTPATEALRSRTPVVLDELGFVTPSALDAKQLRAQGARSSCCVIIGELEQPFGVLAVHSDAPAGFDEDDVTFLQAVAHVIAAAAERDRRAGELEFRLHHDPLTGLANRALLRMDVDRALADAARDRHVAALAVLDLDGFKDVNDGLGHELGDQLLAELAPRLTRAVRPTDTVARVGGDEFAILLTGLRSTADAERLSVRLLGAVAEPVDLEGTPVRLSASIGIAMYPRHGRDYHELLRCADVAMYRAKRHRDTACVFDPVIDVPPSSRLPAITALRTAIEGEQLELYYQPVVELATRELRYLEALIRWHHPVRGLLGPVEFIELAEQTGLIAPLTDWVVHRAVQDSLQLSARGPTIPIAVNLSAATFEDELLADRIVEVVRASHLSASALSVEVTESALLSPGARAVVERLTAAGITVAVDDFGTGYSSLSYLKNLAVDTLKIDRSFVTDFSSDHRDQDIVRAIVEMARGLELTVVAEGVEEETVAARLYELGVALAQGYCFAHPMAMPALAAWLDGVASRPRATGEDSSGVAQR